VISALVWRSGPWANTSIRQTPTPEIQTYRAGFPVSVGADAYSITIDTTNQLLYVADEGAAHISGFTLDASTGALTPMSGSHFPAGNRPQFIATF
jgi:6-phosphogluconolactonase (cycloisomerase 2 family)